VQLNIGYPTADYTEVSQRSQIKFSLGLYKPETDTLHVLFKPVRCREYFNDIALKQSTGKSFRIYGFDGDLVPVFNADDKVYLMVCGHNADQFMDIVAKLRGMMPEDLELVHFDAWSAIHISSRIYSCSAIISLLTLYIRIMELNGVNWEKGFLQSKKKMVKSRYGYYEQFELSGMTCTNEYNYIMQIVQHLKMETTVCLEVLHHILSSGSNELYNTPDYAEIVPKQEKLYDYYQGHESGICGAICGGNPVTNHITAFYKEFTSNKKEGT